MEFWEQNDIIGKVNGLWDALIINREEDKILNNEAFQWMPPGKRKSESWIMEGISDAFVE